MARELLSPVVMLLEAVYQYRALIGKSELGCGLDWEEIDDVSTIERTFAPPPSESRRGRRFRRDLVSLVGFVRGDRINDRIDIVELGPGGLVCRKAPFIGRGEQVEIAIDHGDRSFRFGAQCVWLRDDGDDYRIGLAFIGMPVCLNKVQLSRHELDLVDRIAAAA